LKVEVNPNDLRFLYWEKGMSITEVAKELNIGSTTVKRKMVKFGIPTRTPSKAYKLAYKKFDYLGFQKGNKYGEVNKGRSFTENQRKQISETLKRHYQNAEFKATHGFQDRPLLYNWDGEIIYEPYEPYSKEFYEMQSIVKRRDKFTCQFCKCNRFESFMIFGVPLYVHHIDYNKKNNKLNNLITLCCKCHGKTNMYRETWEVFFVNMMANKRFAETEFKYLAEYLNLLD